MSEEKDIVDLKPCPFCGGAAKTMQYNGTLQATCAPIMTECAGADVMAPVAMWNRRAASEIQRLRDQVREAVDGAQPLWSGEVAADKAEITRLRGEVERLTALASRPIVPEWPISTDGPHTISILRRSMARWLMDSKLDDDEAYGCVAFHPCITDRNKALSSAPKPEEG